MKWRPILFSKLEKAFTPLHMELVNESPSHGLPESAEKHFRLVMVSSKFEGQSRVDRQRAVNAVIADELRDHVHAFTMQVFTPDEWEKKQGATFASPACLHGGKREGIS